MIRSRSPTLLHPVVSELLVLLRDDNAVSPESFLASLDDLELRVQVEEAPLSTIEAIETVRLMAVRYNKPYAEGTERPLSVRKPSSSDRQ
jgi:hypothetical protein